MIDSRGTLSQKSILGDTYLSRFLEKNAVDMKTFSNYLFVA